MSSKILGPGRWIDSLDFQTFFSIKRSHTHFETQSQEFSLSLWNDLWDNKWYWLDGTIGGKDKKEMQKVIPEVKYFQIQSHYMDLPWFLL